MKVVQPVLEWLPLVSGLRRHLRVRRRQADALRIAFAVIRHGQATWRDRR